jgi:outer membrane beta-barrel protein
MWRFILLILIFTTSAFADDKAPQGPATGAPASEQPADNGQGERVNVENIKQKYWARGDESELGVVQNRLYSKSGKFELALFAGLLSTDPFLNVSAFGGSLGYHMNEYLSLHAVGWTTSVKPSSAFEGFQENISSGGGIKPEPDTNYQKWFAGAELRASLLYGKLSVVGKAIIYYDFHLTGGAGVMKTETGSDFTPYLGLGQQVFLSKALTLLIDYRLMTYNEVLLRKSNPANPGALGITRRNWTNAITLGLSFMFGFSGEAKK